jgi:ribonuclease-3
MTDWQRRVAAFARRHALLHEPPIHILDLVSEIGEVAKEALLATDYGRKAPMPRPELADELGDALYSLLALTEACGVDANSVLSAALEKYERRLAERGEAGSENVLLDNRPPVAGVEALQQSLGYRFRDPGFLRRALTHPSYVNEHPEDETGDNQRLEFLGDAVLDFVAGAWVYRHYPDFDEGRMTRLRAALVRTETLARLARQVGVGETLRLGRGEEESGGRGRDANLCDAFEAVVGALYLDGGLEAVETLVEPLIRPVAEAILAAEADRDAKSRLQEWSQAELGVTPCYRVVSERGPDHAKVFVAQVLLGSEVAGQGEGRSKQVAEQAAARVAWKSLMQSEPEASGSSPLGGN